MKSLISIGLVLLFAPLVFAASGRSVSYQVKGNPYQGFYIDAGKDAPLVLLVHDWDGLTDYEIKRAHMLAGLGYSVFVADLFGADIRPTTVEDKKRLTGQLYQDREKMRALLYGALDEAAAKGADITRAVAVGYCFGGAAVLELARSGADLKGFVSFHGGLATPDKQDYSKTRGQILVMHGTADSHVSMDEFADLAKRLELAGISHEMITYGGARHAFTVFGSDRYNKNADRRSWARFTDFLENTLK